MRVGLASDINARNETGFQPRGWYANYFPLLDDFTRPLLQGPAAGTKSFYGDPGAIYEGCYRCTRDLFLVQQTNELRHGMSGSHFHVQTARRRAYSLEPPFFKMRFGICVDDSATWVSSRFIPQIPPRRLRYRIFRSELSPQCVFIPLNRAVYLMGWRVADCRTPIEVSLTLLVRWTLLELICLSRYG